MMERGQRARAVEMDRWVGVHTLFFTFESIVLDNTTIIPLSYYISLE